MLADSDGARLDTALQKWQTESVQPSSKLHEEKWRQHLPCPELRCSEKLAKTQEGRKRRKEGKGWKDASRDILQQNITGKCQENRASAEA